MPTSFPPGDVLRPAHPLHPMRAVWALAAVLSVAIVVGHAPFLPVTLDGIDSANFVLAVDRYDPGLHQPHPPGYPVYVALGRVVDSAYRAVMSVSADGEIGTAAAGLRMWSVICGSLAMLVMTRIAVALGAVVSRGWLVAALAATCPLFWITAMRPLSDVPGLLFAMCAQALALSAYNHGVQRSARATEVSDTRDRFSLDRRLVAAAFIAGLAVGVRVQTALLTLPLLTVITLLRARRHESGLILQSLVAVIAGLLVWAVPTIYAVGGVNEYLRLLTTVAADDVQGVELLATTPTPRLFALALVRTFIVPWGSPVLGWSAFVLAALGAIALAKHNKRVLGLIAVMGLPYLIFHLLFQESASIRYALPLVPLCCLLMVANLRTRPRRVALCIAAAVFATSTAVTVNAATAYVTSTSPVARAVDQMKRQVATQPRWPTLAFHHATARAMRGEPWSGEVLSAPVRYEWLELGRYWLDGGRERVWFLADARRTDLALIDPQARRLMHSYRWPENAESLLGGIQPPAVSWFEITSPGWFLMHGWSLTPETNGLSRRDRRLPGTTGSVGHIRRRAAGAVMMIGGRNLGGPCETAAMIEVSIDDRPRARWNASSQSSFLEVIALSPGELVGAGDYATIKVTAHDVTGGGRVVDVAIEDFNVQSPGAALAASDRGWHTPELDPNTGVSWRWASETAELRAEGFGSDIELVIRGESALRYFQSAPRVVVMAGQTELASFHPDSDFEWTIPVPASVLAENGGRLTIQSDRSFVPDETSHNGDHRRLALRIYSIESRLRR